MAVLAVSHSVIDSAALCRCVLMTLQEHMGVTYIIFNEDHSPRMLIHNKCPVLLLLKETVKGLGPRTGFLLWSLCPLPRQCNHLHVFSCRNPEDGGPLSPSACQFFPAPRALPPLLDFPRVSTERRVANPAAKEN